MKLFNKSKRVQKVQTEEVDRASMNEDWLEVHPEVEAAPEAATPDEESEGGE